MRKIISFSLVLFSAFIGAAFAQNRPSDNSTDESNLRSGTGIELVQLDGDNQARGFLVRSIDQLKKNYNKNLSVIGLSKNYKLSGYEFEEGEALNSAKFTVTDNWLLSVFLDKENDAVQSLVMVLDPKTEAEGGDAALAIIAAVKTFSPDLTKEEAAAIVLQMVNSSEKTPHYVTNGIKYSIKSGSGLPGIWFFAGPDSL